MFPPSFCCCCLMVAFFFKVGLELEKFSPETRCNVLTSVCAFSLGFDLGKWIMVSIL